MRFFKLHPKVRGAVKEGNLPREHVLILLRMEPKQHLALVEEVMEKGLTI